MARPHDPAQRHIGPTAQEFHAAFGVGLDDQSICTVDADGVALAAIQGLNEKVEVGNRNSASRIQKLEVENAELRQELLELKRLIEQRMTTSSSTTGAMAER